MLLIKFIAATHCITATILTGADKVKSRFTNNKLVHRQSRKLKFRKERYTLVKLQLQVFISEIHFSQLVIIYFKTKLCFINVLNSGRLSVWQIRWTGYLHVLNILAIFLNTFTDICISYIESDSKWMCIHYMLYYQTMLSFLLFLNPPIAIH